jgi:5-methylcytosine-specific restriction protein A
MTAKYDNADGRMRGRKLQARRLKVWAQDPRCAVCRKLTAYPDGFQLDHKVPLFKGGEDTDANCQVLCAPNGCHDRKTAKDMGYREKVAISPDGWPM